ncbi:MAG: type II toxin-antitoxin system Phd/YefM family antitoxin, partial [Synergistaceae bacterium]|nr:type II toxin-antitoxin system Phd/YefM family antitoxin [Synergistaceae bacterium]
MLKPKRRKCSPRYNAVNITLIHKEKDTMTATTLTKAQKNLPQLVDDVNDSCRPVIIVNEGSGKNAVLVSEDDWNSIQETMYLYS